MNQRRQITWLGTAIVALALIGASRPAMAGDSWSYSVTPYLWLPNVNGELNYQLPADDGGGILDVEVGPNEYLSNLELNVMVSGEARKGRCSLVTDVVYLDFSGQRSSVRSVDFGDGEIPAGATIDSGSQTALKGFEWTVLGGYALREGPRGTLDLVAGVRYFSLDTSADWELTGEIEGPGPGQTFARTGTVSTEADLWDGIIGVRGRVRLGEHWNLPYHFDAGAGSSSLTWQALVGVTRSFGWGDVGLVYRHLEWDQDEDELAQGLSFDGPAFSATFRF